MANWQNWKITDEQADLIRSGDVPACEKFYFDNLATIQRMAWRYQEERGILDYFDDLLQGVFVDLFCFESAYRHPVRDGYELTRFIYRSFRYVRFGGIAYLSENDPKLLADTSFKTYFPSSMASLEAPVRLTHSRKDAEEGSLLADLIPARFVTVSESAIQDIKRIVFPFLPPRQAEFFGYYIEGYKPSIIGEHMGIRAVHIWTYFNSVESP